MLRTVSSWRPPWSIFIYSFIRKHNKVEIYIWFTWNPDVCAYFSSFQSIFSILNTLENHRQLRESNEPLDIFPVESLIDLILEHFKESTAFFALHLHLTAELWKHFKLQMWRQWELVSLVSFSNTCVFFHLFLFYHTYYVSLLIYSYLIKVHRLSQQLLWIRVSLLL